MGRRYAIIDNVRREFKDILEGDVGRLFEDDGTPVDADNGLIRFGRAEVDPDQDRADGDGKGPRMRVLCSRVEELPKVDAAPSQG